MEEKTDMTFLDRHTKIDNILMEELLPVLKKLQTGDITVQMAGTEGEDTLQRLLDVAVARHNTDNEIVYFSYPNDGTRAEVAAGDTVLNFRHGTIKAVDGTVTKMSSSLQEQNKDFLRALAFNADKPVVIQLDDRDKTPVKADTWYGVGYQQFQAMTITTTETTNLFAFVCTNPKHGVEMVGEVTIAIGKEGRNSIKSDKDTHFTGAIAQYATEEENITGLESNKITITGVSIQSDQALDYNVMLFGTDGFAAADMDVDEFFDFIDLKLSSLGIRVGGAGQYYYARTGLAIDYEDEDASNELHVALQNASAAGKNAGATGEVKIKVSYIPRL